MAIEPTCDWVWTDRTAVLKTEATTRFASTSEGYPFLFERNHLTALVSSQHRANDCVTGRRRYTVGLAQAM